MFACSQVWLQLLTKGTLVSIEIDMWNNNVVLLSSIMMAVLILTRHPTHTHSHEQAPQHGWIFLYSILWFQRLLWPTTHWLKFFSYEIFLGVLYLPMDHRWKFYKKMEVIMSKTWFLREKLLIGWFFVTWQVEWMSLV